MTAPTELVPDGRSVVVVVTEPEKPTVVVMKDAGRGVWTRTVAGSPALAGASVVVATSEPKYPVVRVTKDSIGCCTMTVATPLGSSVAGGMVTVVGTDPAAGTVAVANWVAVMVLLWPDENGVWMRTVPRGLPLLGRIVKVLIVGPGYPTVKVMNRIEAVGVGVTPPGADGVSTTKVVGSPGEDGVRVSVDVADPP